MVQGSGRRRPSMPLRGHWHPRGDRRCQRRGGDIRVHGHRHGRARQCTRRRMRWQVHGHRHGRARQCTHRRMRWQVQGHVKVGGTSWNPVASSSVTMCGSQPINATGMGAGAVGATGAGTGAGTGAASTRKASSSSQSALCLETPAGCLPQETRTIRADHHDAA